MGYVPAKRLGIILGVIALLVMAKLFLPELIREYRIQSYITKRHQNHRARLTKQLRINGTEKLGLDHIFVITMVAKERRMKLMEAMLDFHNLDAELWPAMTTESHLTRLYAQLRGKEPTNEIACFASHMSIYQEIVRRDLSNALILEDDVDIDLDLVAKWQPMWEQIVKADWDLLYPGYSHIGPLEKTQFPGWFKASLLYCTHAYIISRAFAEHMLKEHMTMTNSIDALLQNECSNDKCKRFASVPLLFLQMSRNLMHSTVLDRRYDEPGSLETSTFQRVLHGKLP